MRRLVLLLALSSGCGETVVPAAPLAWIALPARMQVMRTDHVSASLPGGDVLVAGADIVTERWSATTRAFTTVGPTGVSRQAPALAVLVGGGVMLVGGVGDAGPTAETFHVDNGVWTGTGPLPDPYIDAAAAPLDLGAAIVVGGSIEGGWKGAAIWDVGTRDWGVVAPMSAARIHPTATRLADGRTLIVGGNYLVPEAELFDGRTRLFARTGALRTMVRQHTATLLTNGDVVVIGGKAAGDLISGAIQIYRDGAWTSGGTLATPRYRHTATLLPDGRVLVAGGMTTGDVATASCEYWNPSTTRATAAPAMHQPRAGHAASETGDGVLVTGGPDATAELLTTP